MQKYLTLLKKILNTGNERKDRTGTGTISSFGHQVKYDISERFPLLTTKKVYFKGVVHELLWLLSGDTNIRYLKTNNVNIWNEWADENGNLGNVYGYQWRKWPCANGKSIDQISNVIQQIKTNPYSRRLIVNAWNVGDLENMALPPCHMFFQFYVEDGKLSCQMYQRSADVFLGVPFNIASYSLLTMMIAQVCDLEPGYFIHSMGDTHIYVNHIEQCREQLKRIPKRLPIVTLNRDIKDIFKFKYEDIKLLEYDPYPAIKAPISV